ncbi:hypothetical protein [Cohnella abietis]|uniref:Uncharacterized protein n=1 Tax=Cohnella abietis TaxID=2507935 RepID=A0A3T1CYU1_9BACL|nr:hypothetical protein [Cohnella abietis]BBI31010.1 hypothetical protein KCTCHS21_04090 [Cohnella abietis]
MSKKSVWNKGKHNGGGGATKSGKSFVQAPPTVSTERSASPTINNSPLNSVKRMNRDNWVGRQTRETPK